MGAEAWFDVLHSVLAISLSVVGPVGVVTNDFHCRIGLTLWTLCPCGMKSLDHLLKGNKIVETATEIRKPVIYLLGLQLAQSVQLLLL